MRKILLVCVVLLTFGLATQPHIASAQTVYDWCHEFLFEDNNGGFSLYGAGQGEYVGGSGWEARAVSLGGFNRMLAQITKSFSSTSIGYIGFAYDYVPGTQTAGIEAHSIYSNSGLLATRNMPQPSETGGSLVWSGTQTMTSVIFTLQPSRASPTGSGRIYNATFRGFGSDPFGTANCDLEPTAAFSPDVTTGENPLLVTFTDESENDPDTWLWDFGDGDTSTDENPTHTYTEPGVYEVSLHVENDDGEDDSDTDCDDEPECVQTITVESSDLWHPFVEEHAGEYRETASFFLPGGIPYTPYQPLTDWDAGSGDFITDTGVQPIHAMEGGYVYSVDRITLEQCASVDALTSDCKTYDESGTGSTYGLVAQAFFDEYYIVTVQNVSRNRVLRYLVWNAPDYVIERTEITVGCVLGQTIPVNIDGPTGYEHSAFVKLTEYLSTDQLSVQDVLGETYPTSNTPCSETNPNEFGCYTVNAELEPYVPGTPGGRAWNLTNGATEMSGGGYLLPAGAYVYQNFDLLSADFNYPIFVVAEGEGTFQISLGDSDSEVFISTPSRAQFSTILSPTPEGVFHRLQVTALTGSIGLHFICLTDEGVPNILGGQCAFYNPSFTEGLYRWGYSDPVGTNARGLLMGDTGSIGQELTLYDNEDGSSHTYTLEILFGQFDPDAPASAALSVEWGSFSDTITIPDLDYEQLGTEAAVARRTFSVSDPTTDIFQFSASLLEAGPTSSDSLAQIQRICIRPEGNTFPQQYTFEDVVTGGGDRDIAFTCGTVPTPQGWDVINLGIYGIRVIVNKLECAIVPVLNELWNAEEGILGNVKQFMKWVSTVNNLWAKLVQSVKNWIASIVFNFLNHPVVQGALLFLRALFGNLIGRLLDWALEAFGKLRTFVLIVLYVIQIIAEAFNGISEAYANSNPAYVPGFSCAVDPQDSAFCTVIWILDNTVLSPTSPITKTVLVMIATAAFHLVIWTWGEARRTASKSGEAV